MSAINKLKRKFHVVISVINGRFEENEDVSDGSAIYLGGGEAANFTLKNCIFYRNKAGAAPLNLSSKLTKKPILTKDQDVTVYRYSNISPTNVKLYT